MDNGSSCESVSCRLAIRAARFVTEVPNSTSLVVKCGKRGAIEGPIRIPVRSSLFLFYDLTLLCISSNSFKLRPGLFSIPTAPTKRNIPNALLEHLRK